MSSFHKKRIQKVAIILIAAFLISKLLLLIFEKDFNQYDWQSKPQERYEMVDDIIESQLFIGKSLEEVVTLLGEPDAIYDSSQLRLVYKLGNAPSFTNRKEAELVVTFQNNLVVKVTENKN